MLSFVALSPANEDLLTIHSEAGEVELGLLTSRPEGFLPCGLWPLCPFRWPHRVLGSLQVIINPREFGGAARRNLAQEPYTPQLAAGGRSLPRSLQEGLRPHFTTGLEPTLLSAIMMLLSCCTFSGWFGSIQTNHTRKHSAGETGRAETLLNRGDTPLPRKRESETLAPPFGNSARPFSSEWRRKELA